MRSLSEQGIWRAIERGIAGYKKSDQERREGTL